MIKPHIATRKRVEQLNVAKGIGDAEDQRNQHDGADEDQCGGTVEIRFGGVRKSLQKTAAILLWHVVGHRGLYGSGVVHHFSLRGAASFALQAWLFHACKLFMLLLL